MKIILYLFPAARKLKMSANLGSAHVKNICRHYERVEINWKTLLREIDTIQFCGKHNVIHDSNEKEGSSTKKKFLEVANNIRKIELW